METETKISTISEEKLFAYIFSIEFMCTVTRLSHTKLVQTECKNLYRKIDRKDSSKDKIPKNVENEKRMLKSVDFSVREDFVILFTRLH